MPIVVIGIMICFIKEKYQYKIANFFSLWVTVYNLLYIILLCFKGINLYEKPYRVTFQLIVPFLYALLINRIHDFEYDEEENN
jgi:hypothetical protein